MNPATDPRESLARSLAETHLECQAAEHDYRRTLNEGRDHMMVRFPASALKGRPQDLDHFSWHHEAMAKASEQGGLGEIPAIPFHPWTEPATAPGFAE